MKRLLVLGVLFSVSCFPACVYSGPKSIRLPAVDQTVMNSGSALTNCVDELTQRISQTMRSTSRRRVAVVGFSVSKEGENNLSDYLADKLTNNLFLYQREFEVVDRMYLEKAWEEIKLSLSGQVNPETVQELGKILGADTIVVGNLQDLGRRVELICRIIETESASILAVAQIYLPKDEEVNFLLQREKFDQYMSRARKAVDGAMFEAGSTAFKSDVRNALNEASMAVNGALSISPSNEEALALRRLIDSLK